MHFKGIKKRRCGLQDKEVQRAYRKIPGLGWKYAPMWSKPSSMQAGWHAGWGLKLDLLYKRSWD